MQLFVFLICQIKFDILDIYINSFQSEKNCKYFELFCVYYYYNKNNIILTMNIFVMDDIFCFVDIFVKILLQYSYKLYEYCLKNIQ